MFIAGGEGEGVPGVACLGLAWRLLLPLDLGEEVTEGDMDAGV
jgi:hypothetical protein